MCEAAHGLRVGVWGHEHPHAPAYVESLRHLDEVETVLTWESPPSAASPDPRVVHSGRSLAATLRRRELDLLVVCASAAASPRVCTAALSASVPVLAEKPIARRPATLLRLLQLSERTATPLGVAYAGRFQPHVHDARRLVREGVLGPLALAELRMLASQVRDRDPGHWLFRSAAAGGGVLTWLGCHLLDLLEHVGGDPIESVAAEVATRSGEPIDVEDVASLSLRLESGALAAVEVGYVLAGAGAGYLARDAYEISGALHGARGQLAWSGRGAPDRLRVQRGAHVEELRYAPDRAPGYAGEAGMRFLRACLAAAVARTPMPATGRDALRVAQIVAAAYRSARTGRRIPIQGDR
ncbi:MAG TPA: Gfo/Idh/MocA family oxidoreductase [Conexibacter sp.]|jgi:predicted dehydrogenase|nr:Gfo/Idh/MocA family oxidoreductase [Conexibacter sp.]